MTESVAVERLDLESSTDDLQKRLHQQRYDFALERARPEDHVLEIVWVIAHFRLAPVWAQRPL
jgi:hypothetical protein